MTRSDPAPPSPNGPAPRPVQLVATCLAESVYPDVQRDTVANQEHLGITVGFPGGQTCCGPPNRTKHTW